MALAAAEKGTAERLTDMAVGPGLSVDGLDITVIDLHCHAASEMNMAGFTESIPYLVGRIGEDDVEQLLIAAARPPTVDPVSNGDLSFSQVTVMNRALGPNALLAVGTPCPCRYLRARQPFSNTLGGDFMSNDKIALPTGWSIRITCTLDIYVLTLLDERELYRLHGYLGGQPRIEGYNVTVTDIEAIADPRMRDRAQDLLDAYVERVRVAQGNIDEFVTAVPDFELVIDQLRDTLGAALTVTVDPDRLTAVATVRAAGLGAAAVMALLAAWVDADHIDPVAEGTSLELDESTFALTAVLDQTHAIRFLTWYRGNEPLSSGNDTSLADVA